MAAARGSFPLPTGVRFHFRGDLKGAERRLSAGWGLSDPGVVKLLH